LPTTSSTNILNDVCTFTGSLAPGDATIAGARPFRDGVASSCGSAKTCAGTSGAGPYFYDTYTMTNQTCASQCVTVSYVADGASGDCFVQVYNNSYSSTAICTNYKADGGVSSLAGGAGVTFSFDLAANATIVLVVNEAVANTTCAHYTMTVSGINCAPPPPCTSPTASVLSQVQIPGPAVNLFNEQFDGVIPPAGWPVQNLSNPIGVTGWSQTNSAVFAPQSGVGFASANFNNTAGVGTISNWMFTPNVTLKNGDKFSFWTRTTTGTFPDRLQLRQSTNGASVNVGTTETSVGDFSTLLLDINPNLTGTGYPTAWTQYTVTMSGLPAAGVSGRLAFRYFVTAGGPAGANSDFIGIDNAVYTTFTTVNPTTCTGSTANLKVDITGGNSPTYKVVIDAVPAQAGFPMTVTGYVSGANIPVTPAVTTTYNLVSVTAENNCTCVGTGNTGTPTVTVSATPITPIAITAVPDAPLCAGDPTLLSVVSGSPIIASNLSQSSSTAITSGNSVSCNAGGLHTDNSYWRVYNLASYPLAGPFTINKVVFGIELAAGGAQNVIVNLYNQTGAAFPGGTRTLIGTQTVSVPNQNLSLFTANLTTPVTVPNNSTIVVELFTPSGQATGRSFFIGSNSAAETGVSYISAATCGISTPTPIGTVGFPNMHIILNLGGTTGTGATPLPAGWTVLWSPPTGLSNPTSNPTAASPMTTTTYTVMGTAPGGCQTTASKTIVVNQLPAVTTPPSNVTICENGNTSFSIAATGASITYQWQVSINGGGSYTNITNVAPYAGATTNTLTITGAPASFNNNLYRCVVSGTCPPNAISAAAKLTVNPLPVITVSPVSPVCGGLPGVNGTLLTASGATTYTWSPAAGLYTNASATTPYVAGTQTATVYAAPTVNTTYTITGTNGVTGCVGTLKVDVNYKPAAPIVSPAAVTMCLGNPAVPLAVTSSLVPAPFTSTFSSGTIAVAIPEGNFPALPPTAAVSTIPVNLPATAAITNIKVTMNITHAYVGDVVAVLKAPNGTIINLDAMLNKTNNPGANFVNTVISSSGTTLLSAGTAPFTNTFKADLVGATYTAFGSTLAGGPIGFTPNATTWTNTLSSTPLGNWTLALHDVGAPDVGTLTSWSITFDYLYGPPAAGVWTPNGAGSGLFTDSLATTVYTGTPANKVWAKPATSTTYNVTVTSIGPDATPTFSNTAPITINDGSAATPYPAAINVTGLPTTGASVTAVSINGINHTWSDDIDIVLQSPTGQNVILMSDVGGAAGLTGVNYTFSDAAAGTMSLTAGNPSGTYKPTDGPPADNWPAPGPGAFAGPNPTLATFTGNFNGTWKLFIVDDTFGDQGNITGGYSISFKYATVGCVSNSTQVPVTVNVPLTFNPALPADAVVCTDKVTSFTSAVSGSVINHNWRVSTNNGNNWSDVVDGGVYAGAKTATLIITAPPVSMTTYLYKDSVSTVACHDSSSRIAKLIVNPLPTIVISASPFKKLLPGLRTTLFSTVTPAAFTYTWLKNGTPVPNSNTGSLLIGVDGIGDYTLRVTDVNGCSNISNQVTITDSVSGRVFIYPNPNSGQFQVRFYSVANNTNLPRGINVYDARGKRVLTQTYSVSAPYQRMDVDLRNQGTGVYWIEVVDVAGNRLGMGRAEVLR
jgi:subtilisin-like proprotein convertase family protein